MNTLKHSSAYNLRIALAVSLGGFLFGFDAAVISGVTGYIVPEFKLTDLQQGWAVSCLTLASTIAMLVSGPISDRFGRKRLLQFAGLFYALSALFSALAPTFTILVIARMLGGLAVGTALILAPMYIAETSSQANRGRMVSVQQLNIVLGFSAAYFSNDFLQKLSVSESAFALEQNLSSEVWRWMLGIEFIPAILFFLVMFFVPFSPRWLMLKQRKEEAKKIMEKIHGPALAASEFQQIEQSLGKTESQAPISALWKPALRLVVGVGLIVGILQQITGVNAIYFYATTIFEQSGVGKNAAFTQAVWIGIINVVFTLLAMALIDKLGRRPLLLIGTIGVALSMGLTAYGFSQASFNLSKEKAQAFEELLKVPGFEAIIDKDFESDLAFKGAVKNVLNEHYDEKEAVYVYATNESKLIESSIRMNPVLILIGILGFVASFAFSLGPVMWVLLSELFPNWIRGIAISFIGFVNSVVSFLVQFVFPWELSNLGNGLTYMIYGGMAVLGFILLYRYMPETKGKSLEQIEEELVG